MLRPCVADRPRHRDRRDLKCYGRSGGLNDDKLSRQSLGRLTLHDDLNYGRKTKLPDAICVLDETKDVFAPICPSVAPKCIITCATRVAFMTLLHFFMSPLQIDINKLTVNYKKY